ncbi:low molecular weight phosphatase family protein [Listeria aquatica]|uniref:Low molecular weight phosphotyrosine protein phosphatase n=1 Tax=Listeria aquatica FSL S10-1188 TaxID=1265818 RepID=W7B5S0_9LIST|nr:low molecular weight phosphatase family protein [Listeria aquatica]EUJ18181.1 low molecular weight phosphotyrosine protein phosphatase [Listeria aquatica FSL S10-1188]
MNVLIICTGNTCRSPIAEGILRAARPDILVRSRGLNAEEGAPLSTGARQILQDKGLLFSHEAHLLHQEDLMWADKIFVMTSAQLALLRSVFPAEEKKMALISPDDEDVFDPFSGGTAEYQAAFSALETAVSERFL